MSFPTSLLPALSSSLALAVSTFAAGGLVQVVVSRRLRIGRRGGVSDSDLSDGDNDTDYDSSDDEYFSSVNSQGGGGDKWGLADAPYKLVLVVNHSLKMGKGKIAAQCCHAAVGCYKRARRVRPSSVKWWERTGCAKVACKCMTEEEMDEIQKKASEKGIPYYFVCDAGRTQIAAGSRTVLGLGPAPTKVFEGMSDHLKLM